MKFIFIKIHQDSRDPAAQLNITKPRVKILLKDQLVEIKGFKLQLDSQVTFRQEIENGKTKYVAIYSNSMNRIPIDNLDIDNGLETFHQAVCKVFMHDLLKVLSGQLW